MKGIASHENVTGYYHYTSMGLTISDNSISFLFNRHLRGSVAIFLE